MKPPAVLLADLRAAKRSLDGRTTWWATLLKAIGFEITQHTRNHLALGLVVCFIPVWLGIVHAVIPHNTVEFHSQVLGHALRVDANELAMISGAINAVTLIIGFMQFAAVRRSSDFDQRLVLAGHPRSCMLVAKLVALVLTAVLTAVYAAIVMDLFWEPRQSLLMAFSLFTSALTYGGLGMVLGLALSTELAGMFVIIMVSLVDVMVQNPIINPRPTSIWSACCPPTGRCRPPPSPGSPRRAPSATPCWVCCGCSPSASWAPPLSTGAPATTPRTPRRPRRRPRRSS